MILSVVMAYHNRANQFWLTLKSIRRQNQDVEIIVVDDGSDESQRASDVAIDFPELNIETIYLPKGERTWINPCIPFNIGFRKAKGETIVIQSPECLHIGNVLEYALRNRSESHYLAFSCYNLAEFTHAPLRDLRIFSDEVLNEQMKAMVSLEDASSDANTRRNDGCWFNHPVFCPKNYHFLSVLSKKNLDDLGGFDERYAEGYCWDDNEFLWRVKQMGLRVVTVPPTQGFVAHQWHTKGPLAGSCPEWHRNRRLFEEVTKKSKTYRVNQEKRT
jgi:GT2 family glycosyltransferase